MNYSNGSVSVFEVGVGFPYFCRYFFQSVRYFGVDISRYHDVCIFGIFQFCSAILSFFFTFQCFKILAVFILTVICRICICRIHCRTNTGMNFYLDVLIYESSWLICVR